MLWARLPEKRKKHFFFQIFSIYLLADDKKMIIYFLCALCHVSPDIPLKDLELPKKLI